MCRVVAMPTRGTSPARGDVGDADECLLEEVDFLLLAAFDHLLVASDHLLEGFGQAPNLTRVLQLKLPYLPLGLFLIYGT